MFRVSIVDDPSPVHESRVSETAWVSKEELSISPIIDERIYDLLKLPVYSTLDDSLQLLRYRVGGQYICHQDYFWRGTHLETKGVNFSHGVNRFATFFIYFNEPEEGGETAFCSVPSSDGPSNGTCKGYFAVKPKAGTAIFWYNLKPAFSAVTELMQPDPMSLHAGCPVWKGKKYAANKWIFNKHPPNHNLGQGEGFMQKK